MKIKIGMEKFLKVKKTSENKPIPLHLKMRIISIYSTIPL